MNRDAALAIIRSHEAELRKLGVLSLSLFGSTARDEAGAGSDIDVAVTLEPIRGGFATFGRLDRIREFLSARFAKRVDVIPDPATPGPLRASIDRDRQLAF